MPVTVIPSLPPPPNRASLSLFESRADTFMSFLPTWHAALNTFGAEVQTAASGCDAARIGAESARDEAVSQGSATLYNAATAYDSPDVVIGSNGLAYRCLSTTQVTGDNPVTSTTGAWMAITGVRYVTLYVDSLAGDDANTGLSLARALKTLDKAMSLVTGATASINATIYLASDRTDYTLSSRRTLLRQHLQIAKTNPPAGRTAGTPKITQEATIDGVSSMPCINLVGGQLTLTKVDIATAASIPEGTFIDYQAPIQGVGGLCAVTLYDLTVTLAAAPLVRIITGLGALSLSVVTINRPSGAAFLIVYAAAQVAIGTVTRTNGGAWNTYLNGAVMHAATSIPMNLLSNVALSA